MSYTPKHFKPYEFECSCGCGGGMNEMDNGFLVRLDRLRALCGFPIILSSAYRCPEYNNEVSSTGLDGPHTTGKAVDILVSGHKAHKVLQIAAELGFQGIGVSQKGDHGSRFIHLDMLSDDLRPWVWSY